MKKYICIAIAMMSAFATSCDEVEPIGPDQGGSDEAVIPEFYYTVDGVYHEIRSAAIYHDEGFGYNMVFSEVSDNLCGGYDRLNDRLVGVMNVDLPEVAFGRENVVGVDEIETEDWSFFVNVWDPKSYAQTSLGAPADGEFSFVIDGRTLTAEMTVVGEDGVEICVHYVGNVTTADDYIWCGFFNGGSFSVDGVWSLASSATLFYDSDNRGYNLSIASEDGVNFVVDIAESAESNWSMKASAYVDGNKTAYAEYAGEFTVDKFAFGGVDTDRNYVDIDVELTTSDGHKLCLYYHGFYSVGSNYQKRRANR